MYQVKFRCTDERQLATNDSRAFTVSENSLTLLRCWYVITHIESYLSYGVQLKRDTADANDPSTQRAAAQAQTQILNCINNSARVLFAMFIAMQKRRGSHALHFCGDSAFAS